MRRVLPSGLLVGLLLFIACERPQAPDFKLDHKLQAPLTVNKTYSFLGASNALIDTTSEEFDSLFVKGEEGLVHLSREDDFRIGDLSDAIPEIEVNTTTVNSKVGEIELGNFDSGASGEGVGSASFSDITGRDASTINKGEELPAGSSGVILVEVKTDYFESAAIKEGGLKIRIINNLGFTIHGLSVSLYAGNNILDTKTTNESILPGAPFEWLVQDLAGKTLQDLKIELNASWDEQTMEGEPENLVVQEVQGDQLVASEVTAAIGSQEFSSNGSTTVDDAEFKFKSSYHFVELDGGELAVAIQNDIDVAVEELMISFPKIKKNDVPLTISIPRVPGKSDGGALSKTVSLKGYSIFAECNCIEYNVIARTENMQQGPNSPRATIRESDSLQAVVNLNNLELKKAYGYIEPLDVLLSEDDPSNGSGIDLFNNQEAEVTKIDGISSLSKQISNLTFINPLLNLSYDTNLGVNTTIYAAILGVNERGEKVFLHSSEPNNEFHVPEGDIPQQFRSKGKELHEGQVIKFKLPMNGSGTTFDDEHTNISEFFSSLPSSIRFIGIAKVNEGKTEGKITNPITFNPRLGMNIPINISADNASFSDTVKADLSGLPGNGDDRQLSKAVMTFSYTNNLPLDLQLKLHLQDQEQKIITTIGSNEPLSVKGAPVGESGFTEGSKQQGELKVTLTDAQLDLINQTRFMELDVLFNTSGQKAVKIKGSDSVSFQIKMSVNVTSTVN